MSFGPDEMLVKRGDPATHMYDDADCVGLGSLAARRCLNFDAVLRECGCLAVLAQVHRSKGSRSKAGQCCRSWNVLRRRFPADDVLPTVRRPDVDVLGLLPTGKHGYP